MKPHRCAGAGRQWRARSLLLLTLQPKLIVGLRGSSEYCYGFRRSPELLPKTGTAFSQSQLMHEAAAEYSGLVSH